MHTAEFCLELPVVPGIVLPAPRGDPRTDRPNHLAFDHPHCRAPVELVLAVD